MHSVITCFCSCSWKIY